MKRLLAIILCLMTTMLLVACEDKEMTFSEPTINVFKDGTVSQTFVESFDKEYYSLQELKGEIGQSINEYVKTAGDSSAVVLTDAHVEDDRVFVSLNFASCEDSSRFQGNNLFYGTLSEAYDMGYSLDVTLMSVADSSLIEKKEIMGMADNQVLILDSPGVIIVPRKIQFISANVEYIDEKTARISSDSDGLAYIVMK